MKYTILLLLVLLHHSHTLFSQPIFLRSGTFQPKSNITTSGLDSFTRKAARFSNQAFGVLQFEQLPTPEEKEKLASAGITLLDYLPQNAFTVSVKGIPSPILLQNLKAKALFQLLPHQKMQEQLAKGLLPSWAVKSAGTVDVWVSFYKTVTADSVIRELQRMTVEILSTEHLTYHILSLRIASNQLTELAALPFVEYLQPAPPRDQPLNDNSRTGSRATFLNAAIKDGGRGLAGEGVVIGHGDNADLQAHADFYGRLVNRNASPFNAHGVHTAGVIAGAGNINELYRGYAPKSTLVSQAFSGILINTPNYVRDYGMVITNNSYGSIIDCEYHGTYDLSSRMLDQQTLDLPSLLHVFSAGNSGANTCAPNLPGYRTVLGGYQSAKNTITVGASNDSGLVAGFSSRGPVHDGRIKPDLLAMGQGVISTWPTNTYSINNGTSMSAPAVSGGLALLYQRYRQLHGTDPKNGLMKVLLCNGAADRGPAGPDFQYGYGWMNLLRSLEMLEKTHYFTGFSTHNGVLTHPITVTATTAKLKVMLYWNDVPASVISIKTLVNDLDLEVLDPSGKPVLPAVLDTAAAALGNKAVSAADHVNNMEQVVISTPAAGTYTIRIKGTTVTTQQQEYFVAFDAVATGVKLTAPAGSEALVPGTTTKIAWDSEGLTGLATLEFSADSGNTWTMIANAVDVNRYQYTWTLPAIATHQALVKITSAGFSSVSHPFTILGQPTLSLSPVQCEGYIAFEWTPVAGATDYEVMRLTGNEMVPVSISTSTSYIFSGLLKDSTYFVTVRARVNGKPGRRAVALSRLPAGGNCSGDISNSDLKLDALLSPRSGRKLTSSELSGTEIIRVRLKNLDDMAVSNFTIAYSINGSTAVYDTVYSTLAPGSFYEHAFTTPVNFSAAGIYALKVYVVKTGDQNKGNDTLTTIIKQVANAPVNLQGFFTDNLELATPASYERESVGINGVERYDFNRNTSFGRLRTFVNSGNAFSGAGAFTLDANRYVPLGNTNHLTGTFNLQEYSAVANDIRFDFMYRHHNQFSHSANQVWIRGSDTQPWITVYNLDTMVVQEGHYKKTKSIELSHLLSAHGQAFTSSFGIRWGQWGQWPATDVEGEAGYTIDDVRLYQVANDVQLLSIDSPATSNCGLLPASHIVITVRNSSSTILTNVPVQYRVDNGVLVKETIPSLAARTTVQYRFATPVDLSATGPHSIETMAALPTDTFRENDTVKTNFYHQPVITSFPYLQNFENGNGHFYTGGMRSSWAWGEPQSRKINKAASGNKAWKTSLTGTYNDKELSYLYSPCFSIGSLTTPTLSFSLALDIEDCGTTQCDAAWVEYSADGITWEKLGTAGTGTNWYNKTASKNHWSIQNYTAWHVATQALPKGVATIRFRFVFLSDAGVTGEGIAIDDIHIYDNTTGIYEEPATSSAVTQPIASNNWVQFTEGGKLLASVQPLHQLPGAITVQAFINKEAAPVANNQNYLARHFTIKTSGTPTDSVRIRLYFLDKEVDSLLKAKLCPSCSPLQSAYELGISQYSDPEKEKENGSLLDNVNGLWHFFSSKQVAIVPFDKGYYAEFQTTFLSEFWLNKGGPDGNTPLPVKLMTLTVMKQGDNVLVNWQTGSESNLLRYEVEVARDTEALQEGRFEKLGEVKATSYTAGSQFYHFTDTEKDKIGARYYRLKIINTDGTFRYSPVRMVLFEDIMLWQVYPNPGPGAFSLLYQLPAAEIVTAKVYSATGILVKEISSAATGFPQKLMLDISANKYASGMYLLRLQGGGKEKVFKLYKM